VLLTELEDRLREAGLRVTSSRVAVLRVLSEADDHPRVDQVIERVRLGGLSISTQAAYDVCEALRERGLARRIALAGGPARYEARVGDNHHHLVRSDRRRRLRDRRRAVPGRARRPGLRDRRG
jgi:Fe2+ or Zn2+ uptake regulation protein